MSRANFDDLQAFVIITREGSFTRAAGQLGVSQSALSHTMRALEARLGVRLLTRTTRSVAPTEAGQRLYLSMAPRVEEIELELTGVSEFRDTPADNVRISASEHAANNILWPTLLEVLGDYPDIKVEVTVDYALSDIVAQRDDAGVRLGDLVAKDMFAGCGLAFLPEDMAHKEIADGSLIRVLEDWCQPFPGYHLYYPNRREHSSAFGVVFEALRYRR